jgi:hypothetical protein
MVGATEPQYEATEMTNKFLPAVMALVLAFGSVSAEAIPANGPSLANYPAAEGFAHQGRYLVDFVQGREVTPEPRGGASAASTTEDGAARYASQSAVLTIVFLALVAMALAGFGAIGNVRRKVSRREPAPMDAWEGALLEMLKADLTNLDSVTHGFSGR